MNTTFQKQQTDWNTFFSQKPRTFEEVVGDPAANRIDILVTKEFISFRTFARHNQLDYVERPTDFALSEFTEKMAKSGWIVREWPGGARLFKGELFPVRSAGQILDMKRRIEETSNRYQDYTKLSMVRELDLAFDL